MFHFATSRNTTASNHIAWPHNQPHLITNAYDAIPLRRITSHRMTSHDMTWHDISQPQLHYLTPRHLTTNHIISSHPAAMQRHDITYHITAHYITTTDTLRQHNQPPPKRRHHAERSKAGTNTRFDHRTGWSPCPHSIGIFFWFLVCSPVKPPPPAGPGICIYVVRFLILEVCSFAVVFWQYWILVLGLQYCACAICLFSDVLKSLRDIVSSWVAGAAVRDLWRPHEPLGGFKDLQQFSWFNGPPLVVHGLPAEVKRRLPFDASRLLKKWLNKAGAHWLKLFQVRHDLPGLPAQATLLRYASPGPQIKHIILGYEATKVDMMHLYSKKYVIVGILVIDVELCLFVSIQIEKAVVHEMFFWLLIWRDLTMMNFLVCEMSNNKDIEIHSNQRVAADIPTLYKSLRCWISLSL